MPNQHELIADLESEIDALRDEAERCRKIDIAAKIAFGLGTITLVTSFVQASAFALVIGIAAVLGSVALSNRRTRGEIMTLSEHRKRDALNHRGLELQDGTRGSAP